MGLHWHLKEAVAAAGLDWAGLEERLGFAVGSGLKGAEPPIDLSLPIVADLCQALGCQPGDLLTFTADDVAAQAERMLAQDLTFQSFLSYQADKKRDGLF